MTADHNPSPEPAGSNPTPLPAHAAPSQTAHRKRRWLFRLAALLLSPVAAFGLLEIVLRLAGFGYPTAFLLPFSPDGGKTLVQNNRFAWRFLGPQLSRLPYALSIPKPQPPRTVRIFVMGESAAFGDPLPAFGLSRMLQAVLSLRYPGVQFEVENTAMTAINSHAILPIARDCARAGGDLWVIYMGNNEVVGPFGAGTVFGPQTPPLPLIRASLAVKSTRTGQWLDSLRQHLGALGHKRSGWTGMSMFVSQQVPARDPRMARVYSNFKSNLDDILGQGIRRGIGIVLSTVAVNLKDCPPMASEHRPGLSALDESKWAELYQRGSRFQDEGSNSLAADQFAQAAKLDDAHAELRFRQGECALALDHPGEARQQFIAARDLDTLRFRCDSRLNDLIRQAAARTGTNRVRLADADRAFAEQSPDGLPGEQYFYEHVHLTFDGNYLLARTVADQLEPLLPNWVTTGQKGAQAAWPSEADCARRLAWSPWSLSEALGQMLGRVSQPPFSAQLHHEERSRRLQAELEKLETAGEPAGLNLAARECEQALASAPDDATLYAQLVTLKMRLGDFDGAERYAVRQTELLPSNPVGWFQLGMIRLRQRDLKQSIAAFDRALEVDPRNLPALVNRANVLLMQDHSDAAIREYRRALRINPNYSIAWIALGKAYAHTGYGVEADDCFEKAVANNSDPAETPQLAGFCQSRGWMDAAATNYDEALKLEPTNPRLHLDAGKNLMDMLRYSLAADQFREAIRLKPDAVEPHIRLGMALSQEGRSAEAAAQFDEVLRLDPTNSVALQYRQDLRANPPRPDAAGQSQSH